MIYRYVILNHNEQSAILETADLLVKVHPRLNVSLWDVGYRIITLDDCWMNYTRDAAGNLVPGNPTANHTSCLPSSSEQ